MEQAANDVEAIVGLEKTKEAFMPGRFDQKQDLEKLQKLPEAIDQLLTLDITINLTRIGTNLFIHLLAKGFEHIWVYAEVA